MALERGGLVKRFVYHRVQTLRTVWTNRASTFIEWMESYARKLQMRLLQSYDQTRICMPRPCLYIMIRLAGGWPPAHARNLAREYRRLAAVTDTQRVESVTRTESGLRLRETDAPSSAFVGLRHT